MKKRELICCTPVSLPADLQVAAAMDAIRENPANAPANEFTPSRLALLTSKWWGAGGVDLAVSFMEATAPELRDRILSHMNAWGEVAQSNVRFRWSQSGGALRITRGGSGYWSYLGTDIKSIPANQPTMCLQGFTLRTSEAEYRRVVRHETGHSLGFPHEQQRQEILDLLDEQKTIAYFRRTQGWSEQEVRQQVLTPLNPASIIANPAADTTSIMCYQFPGECTRSGQPIPGGPDINARDIAFVQRVYPRAVVPPPPPSGPVEIVTLVGLDASGAEVARYKKQ